MSAPQNFYDTDPESTDVDSDSVPDTDSDADWSDDTDLMSDETDVMGSETPMGSDTDVMANDVDAMGNENGATADAAMNKASGDDSSKNDKPKKGKNKNRVGALADPRMQLAVHNMLTHLQQWWESSESLLQAMAAKNLPCESLSKMSDQIDHMLDKAIGKMLKSSVVDPSAFPIAALVQSARSIKKYVFLKVGEVCCQAGNKDNCAKMAKNALVSLKKFRNSANDLYDHMIAQVLDAMDSEEDDIATPEMNELLKQMRK